MYKTLLVASALIACTTCAPLSQPTISRKVGPLRRGTGEVLGSAAVPVVTGTDGTAGSDSYTQFAGDGSRWPSKDSWMSFDAMFDANRAFMAQSCSKFGQANDSDEEISDIRQAIESTAATTKLDHRFILAIMMQESGGCVRAPTSGNGVRNPGLLQDHDGKGTCNSDITGVSSNPCPTDQINLMIQEGAVGTPSGDGLTAVVNQAQTTHGASGAQAFYIAARIYNSGTVDPSGDLGAGGATASYASDIANRLTGWVFAPHGYEM